MSRRRNRVGNPSDSSRWRGLMPTRQLAREQTNWERRHALLRAHETGATVATLAAWLRQPWPFVEVLIARAQHERRTGARSPAERWIAAGAAELRRAVPLPMAAE